MSEMSENEEFNGNRQKREVKIGGIIFSALIEDNSELENKLSHPFITLRIQEEGGEDMIPPLYMHENECGELMDFFDTLEMNLADEVADYQRALEMKKLTKHDVEGR